MKPHCCSLDVHLRRRTSSQELDGIRLQSGPLQVKRVISPSEAASFCVERSSSPRLPLAGSEKASRKPAAWSARTVWHAAKGIQVPFLQTSMSRWRPGARRSNQTADLEAVQSEPRGFRSQDGFLSISLCRRRRRLICFLVFTTSKKLWNY